MDNIMWVSDYPHTEGSFPFTKEHLRLTFGDLPIEDTTKLLTSNVARLYRFDVNALRPLADKHCPTKAEVATPIDYSEIPEEAKGCPGMNPLNQVQMV